MDHNAFLFIRGMEEKRNNRDKTDVTITAFTIFPSFTLIRDVGVYGAIFGIRLNTYDRAIQAIVPSMTPKVLSESAEKNTVSVIEKIPNNHHASIDAVKLFTMELPQK